MSNHWIENGRLRWEPDEWPDPAPIPSGGIFDSDYVCIQVNAGWISPILGALLPLADARYWDGDETQQYNASQEVLKLIAALSAPAASSSCGDLDFSMLTTEIAANGISFRFKTIADGTPVGDWIPIPTPTPAAASVPHGTPPSIAVTTNPLTWTFSIPEGAPGTDGREIELGTSATHIQWRYVGDTLWTDLIALTEIEGEDGTNGTDGREIELQAGTTHIQWRYVGDTLWNDLVPLADLVGPAGADGQPGTDGQDGADAPIPIFTWDGYLLQIDTNGDGTPETISQSLRGPAGQDGVSPLPPTVTQIGTRLQIDANNDGINEFDADLVGQQGPTGVCDCVPEPPPLGTETDNICAAVVGTVDWLKNGAVYMVDQIDTYAGGTLDFAQIATEVALHIAGPVPVLLFTDLMVQLIRATESAGTNAVRLFLNNPDKIDRQKEVLFCQIANAEEDRLLESRMNTWLDTLDIEDAEFGYFTGFARSIDFNSVRDRFYAYGQNTDNACAALWGCVEATWEHTFDSATDPIASTAGLSYMPGFGADGGGYWEGDIIEDNGRHKALLYIRIKPDYGDETTLYTEVEWEVYYSSGIESGYGSGCREYSDGGGYNNGTPGVIVNGAPPKGSWQIGKWTYSQGYAPDDSLVVSHFGQQLISSVPPNITSRKLIVRGTGKNPFVP